MVKQEDPPRIERINMSLEQIEQALATNFHPSFISKIVEVLCIWQQANNSIERGKQPQSAEVPQ